MHKKVEQNEAQARQLLAESAEVPLPHSKDDSMFWHQLRVFLLGVADRELGVEFGGKLDASDIAQKSMLEVQSSLDDFRGKTNAEFRAWLTRIVERNVIDVGRHYRQTQCRDISRELRIDDQQRIAGNSSTASSIMIRNESDADLVAAIAKLSERRRRVLELRHRDSITYAEIGNEMGLSKEAARKLYSRAIKELRGLLKVEETEENR